VTLAGSQFGTALEVSMPKQGGGTISLPISSAADSPAFAISADAASGAVTGLTSISVFPANPTIPPGGTQQFFAVGGFTSGPKQNLTNAVTWSSSNPAVAMISNASGSQGSAAGIAVGSTTITASLGSIIGSANLTVGATAPG